MAGILIVDDDLGVLNVLQAVLRINGFEVFTALGGTKGRDALNSGLNIDLMISDIRMDEVNGMQLLEIARKINPGLPVIMLTAYADLNTATQALKLGAFDYMLKPFKLDQLLLTIRRAIEYKHAGQTRAPDANESIPYEFGSIVALSKAMKNVCEMIRRASTVDIPIVIYGEHGTGKKLTAKVIHENSHRKNEKLLTINCATLPEPVLDLALFGYARGSSPAVSGLPEEGIIERAAGGSVLLEEIDSLPLLLQNKLVRALLDKKITRNCGTEDTAVDVRIIATSHPSLEQRVADGMFLKELCTLLNVINIELCPLRDRPEDIRPLVRHYIRLSVPGGKIPEIDNEFYAIMESYEWPGNLTEMKNVLTQAVAALSDGKLTKASLPPKIAATQIKQLTSSPTKDLEEFRGKALREFIHARQKQYLDQVKVLSKQIKS